MKVSVFKNIITIEKNVEFYLVVKAIKQGWFQDRLFSPSGIISVSGNKKNTLIYTSLVLMTFDADSDEELNRIFQCVIEMSTTYCCFRNHLGNGINVLVKTDCLEGHHKTAYQQVVEAYQNYLCIEVSNYQPDEKILCQLSYDTNIYYNPESGIFQINIKTRKKVITEVQLYEEYKERFDEQVSYTEERYSLTEQTMNDYYGTLSSNCFKAGIPIALTLEFIMRTSNLTLDIKGIVKRVYRILSVRKVDIKDAIYSLHFKNFQNYKVEVEVDKRMFFEYLVHESIIHGIPFYCAAEKVYSELKINTYRLNVIVKKFKEMGFIDTFLDKVKKEDKFPTTHYQLILQYLPQAADELMIDPTYFLQTVMPILYQKDKGSKG